MNDNMITVEEFHALYGDAGVDASIIEDETIVYGDMKQKIVKRAVVYGSVGRVMLLLDGLVNRIEEISFTPFPTGGEFGSHYVIATIKFKGESG